jgi:hypothetical protein
MTGASEDWIVWAEWRNSSPACHGPFSSDDEARAYGRSALDNHTACIAWAVVLLQRPEPA